MASMLGKKKVICVQGKGHSGTRLFADTLEQSNVFMGSGVKRRHRLIGRISFTHVRSQWKHVGDTMDKGPVDRIGKIYELSLPFVSQRSFANWDFSRMVTDQIPKKVQDSYFEYLSDLKNSKSDIVGWKLTDSMLVYPWTVRLFPDWHYIHVVRDVRSHLFRKEKSDWGPHTEMFEKDSYNLPKENSGKIREDIKIALNWKYQLDIVDSIPRPKNFIQVKFEDFLLNQDYELERMSDFLGIKLLKLPVHPEKANQWKEELRLGKSWLPEKTKNKNMKNYYVPSKKIDYSQYSFLNNHMRKLNYEDWIFY